jgi:Putative transmembrane protein (PGPGW)
MQCQNVECADAPAFKTPATARRRDFFDVDSAGELVKKLAIAGAGGAVLMVGVALLVLPGPGIPLVAAGLAILGTQFLWARRALRNAKGAVAKVRRRSGLTAWLHRRRLLRRVTP